MIGAWNINVSGRVYGPFSSERMRAFVGEGRLAQHSLVAREGSADWHEARDEPEFSDVFAKRSPAPAAPVPEVKTQTPAPPSDASAQPVPHAPQPHLRQVNPVPAVEPVFAHFAVIVDQKAVSTASNLEAAITSLGQSYRLTSNVWIISTEQSVSAVRNRLV